MNASINSLLGPLEAATRSGSWEDAEDIAREISRLARLQRLAELKKIEEAVSARWSSLERMGFKIPKTVPRGNQQTKAAPIKQGKSTLIPSAHNHKTPLGPSWSEPWPFG